jgi:hypothetical protein
LGKRARARSQTVELPTLGKTAIQIFGDWLSNPFIYAATLSSLIAGAPEDGHLVDAAGSLLADEPLPNDYYPRCWTLLGNLMLSGAMESAGKIL